MYLLYSRTCISRTYYLFILVEHVLVAPERQQQGDKGGAQIKAGENEQGKPSKWNPPSRPCSGHGAHELTIRYHPLRERVQIY